MNFDEMWVRSRTTKTNGVSYIIQKGGACGEGYFRFSTFGSPEDTIEAANRLTRLLGKK